VTISTAAEYTKVVGAIKKDSKLLDMTYHIDNLIALPDGTEKLPNEIKLSADSESVVVLKNVIIEPIEEGKLNVPISIEATSTDLDTAEFIYTVTDPEGETVTVDDNAQFIPTLRGTYTVKVEINDGTYYGVAEETVEVKKAGELVDFTSKDCVDNFTELYRNDVTAKYTEISYVKNYNGKDAVKFVSDTTDTGSESTRINFRSNWTAAQLINAATNDEFDGISVSLYFDDAATQDYVLWIWGSSSAVSLGTVKAGSWQEIYISKQNIIDSWAINDVTMNAMAAAYNVVDGGHNFLVAGKGTGYGTPATCPIYISRIDFVKDNPIVSAPDNALQGTEVTVSYALSNNELQNVTLSCSVVDPDGQTVSLMDNKFIATKAGTYTVLVEMSGAYTGYAQKDIIVSNTTLLDCTTNSRLNSAFTRTSNMQSITFEDDVKGTGRSGFKFVPNESENTRVNVNFDMNEAELKALMNNESITGIEVDIYFDGPTTQDYTVWTWINSAVQADNAVTGGGWRTIYIAKEKLTKTIEETATIDDWCVRLHSTSTVSIPGGLFDLRAANGWGSASKVDFYLGGIRAASRPVTE
jgi:hypothetical protein